MHSDISWYAEQVNCGDAIVAVSPAAESQSGLVSISISTKLSARP